MPRSTNPQNYGAFFWDLLEAVGSSPKEIRFQLPLARAAYMRAQFYGFIYALERASTVSRKLGEIARASAYKADANSLRGYLTQIYIGKELVLKPSLYRKDHPAELVFFNRDMTDHAVDMLAQLHAQIKKHDTVDVAAIAAEIDKNGAAQHKFKPTEVPKTDLLSKFFSPFKANPNADEISLEDLADYPRSDNAEEQQSDGDSDIQEQSTGDSDNTDST